MIFPTHTTMIWLSRIKTVTKLSEFTYYKTIITIWYFLSCFWISSKYFTGFFFTLCGDNSEGFKMVSMALIDKCWDKKVKFYKNKFYKNSKAETFILFNKSSIKIWRRMWEENNAIYYHISSLTPLFKGSMRTSRNSKKGERIEFL